MSGLKSRRGHAVLSAVLTAMGRRQLTGTREEGSNGFLTAVVPVANSGVCHGGEAPFAFLALAVVGRRPMAPGIPSTNHIGFPAGRGYGRPKPRQSRDPPAAKAMVSSRLGR